jgi:hypothetical protein
MSTRDDRAVRRETLYHHARSKEVRAERDHRHDADDELRRRHADEIAAESQRLRGKSEKLRHAQAVDRGRRLSMSGPLPDRYDEMQRRERKALESENDRERTERIARHAAERADARRKAARR